MKMLLIRITSILWTLEWLLKTKKGYYYDSLFKKDVLLLADVFEQFRETYLEIYRLDQCHYFSRTGLFWDVTLKMTGVKLQSKLAWMGNNSMSTTCQ